MAAEHTPKVAAMLATAAAVSCDKICECPPGGPCTDAKAIGNAEDTLKQLGAPLEELAELFAGKAQIVPLTADPEMTNAALAETSWMIQSRTDRSGWVTPMIPTTVQPSDFRLMWSGALKLLRERRRPDHG